MRSEGGFSSMDINDILPEDLKVRQDPSRDSLRPLTPEETRLFIIDLNRWWTEISQTILLQLPPVKTEQYTPPKKNDPYIPLAHR
jgi:hypothetical protein